MLHDYIIDFCRVTLCVISLCVPYWSATSCKSEDVRFYFFTRFACILCVRYYTCSMLIKKTPLLDAPAKLLRSHPSVLALSLSLFFLSLLHAHTHTHTNTRTHTQNRTKPLKATRIHRILRGEMLIRLAEARSHGLRHRCDRNQMPAPDSKCQ